MRARSWSVLVVVATVLGACSSGSVEVVAPEPPPATEVPAPVVAEPEVAAPAEAAPAGPSEPATPIEAVAPDAAAPGATPGAVTEDDPVPEGSARPAAPTRSGGAPAPGAVQAASAKPAGKPASTGRIEIPVIGLNHLTYEGIDLGTLKYGPGHWPGTPMPGQRGNTVFPGHRTTNTRPFWDLDKLRPGHDVIFTTAAGRFTYKVTQTLIVSSRDTHVVNNTPDATFTILACHPKGSARQRIVVKGRMVVQPPPPTTRPAPTPTTAKPRGFLGLF